MYSGSCFNISVDFALSLAPSPRFCNICIISSVAATAVKNPPKANETMARKNADAFGEINVNQ